MVIDEKVGDSMGLKHTRKVLLIETHLFTEPE